MHNVASLQYWTVGDCAFGLLITISLDSAIATTNLKVPPVCKIGETTRRRDGVGEGQSWRPSDPTWLHDLSGDIYYCCIRLNDGNGAVE